MSQKLPVLEALVEFSTWKAELLDRVKNLSSLIGELGFSSSASMLHLDTLVHKIENDAASVAFVGEFSRGKSELINALFFSDTGKRLMPSSTGQTTMCPVEIRGTDDEFNSLILLPIQSRSIDVSIKKLKSANVAWEKFTFAPEDEKGLSKALSMLTETICVDITEARRLGLCPPLNKTEKGLERTVCPTCGLGKVLIPKWRHAVFSFSHPLLNAGLTILDTPGLNSMGAEPELTLNMLSDTDAILFILAADTGVTQSDHMIWDQYIAKNKSQTHIVLLNKVDTLWDELRSEEDIRGEIDAQIRRTAEKLDLIPEQIIPISGQKGLIARIKKDPILLERSGISVLENAIADVVVNYRYIHIKEQFRKNIQNRMEEQRQGISDSIIQLNSQIQSLKDMQQKGAGKVEAMVEKHKENLNKFDHDRQLFEQKKAIFKDAVNKYLMIPLSTDSFDAIIRSAKEEMLSAWTTGGIVSRFKQFFKDAIASFDVALDGAQKVSDMIAVEYKLMQNRYLLPNMKAIPYAMMPRRSELLEMADKYERFGAQLEIAVNTQNSVVKKTFLTVAMHTRDFVIETRKEAEQWVDDVMRVMGKQMDSFRDQAEEQLVALQQIADTVGSMDARIKHLEDKLNAMRVKEDELTKREDAIYRILANDVHAV